MANQIKNRYLLLINEELFGGLCSDGVLGKLISAFGTFVPSGIVRIFESSRCRNKRGKLKFIKIIEFGLK